MMNGAMMDFDSVFRSNTDYALDSKQVDAIVRNRKELGGILYFDRIWNSIGLKQAQKSYPPKSNAELRNLWQKVVKAEVPNEKKQAILYYILRGCRQPSNIGTTFAQNVYLPTKYQILVAGLWELDHLQFPRALEYLTDPALTPEFADEILLTLLTAPRCDKLLAMAYYNTVQPPLHKKETLEAYFELIAQISVNEAYHFSQTKGTAAHKTLFENLVRLVHAETASATKAGQMVTLLSLAFTDEEEEWFEEYLLRGEGSRLLGAKDSVIMRRLAMGRSIEGPTTVDRYRGQKRANVDWDDIRSTVRGAVS